ncbi:DUF6343 family protein [Streptomyces sp. AJS327]|uniref:DUF6343 family protein n=1 Tax=Streptomyces sp. AJS327 TaxID=2545265 RepID=UPI002155B4A6|nr:DUF6343 family protein [Streptomyces sp. AJS327]
MTEPHHGAHRASGARRGPLRWLPERTGTEPVTALSALRLRLLLSVVFVPLFLAGTVLFWYAMTQAGPRDVPSHDSWRTLMWIGAGITVLAVADLVIVVRRRATERRRAAARERAEHPDAGRGGAPGPGTGSGPGPGSSPGSTGP